jgi:hypothetical protein
MAMSVSVTELQSAVVRTQTVITRLREQPELR